MPKEPHGDALERVFEAVQPNWDEDDVLVSVPTDDLAVYLAETRRQTARWQLLSDDEQAQWTRVRDVLQQEMHARVRMAWRALQLDADQA